MDSDEGTDVMTVDDLTDLVQNYRDTVKATAQHAQAIYRLLPNLPRVQKFILRAMWHEPSLSAARKVLEKTAEALDEIKADRDSHFLSQSPGESNAAYWPQSFCSDFAPALPQILISGIGSCSEGEGDQDDNEAYEGDDEDESRGSSPTIGRATCGGRKARVRFGQMTHEAHLTYLSESNSSCGGDCSRHAGPHPHVLILFQKDDLHSASRIAAGGGVCFWTAPGLARDSHCTGACGEDPTVGILAIHLAKDHQAAFGRRVQPTKPVNFDSYGTATSGNAVLSTCYLPAPGDL